MTMTDSVLVAFLKDESQTMPTFVSKGDKAWSFTMDRTLRIERSKNNFDELFAFSRDLYEIPCGEGR